MSKVSKIDTEPAQALRDYQERKYGPINWKTVKLIKKSVVSQSLVG